MQSETVQSLRALAKQLGLSGYSKLRKEELLKLIAARQHNTQQEPVTGSQAPGLRVAAKQKKPHHAPEKPADHVPSIPSPATPSAPLPQSAADTEQQIESAKYAFVPPGTGTREPAYASDLAEDIENLPEVREPALCLLPQKPGVLHGYWVLPPTSFSAMQPLRLRLAHYTGDRVTLLEEHAVPAERGHWYFHVDEGTEYDAVYLQLGRYLPSGEFVSNLQRGIARIPSLYASSQTDRRWWLSNDQFRAMYRRAGGVAYGARLGWAGSTSSPGGPLAWPGNTSSRQGKP